MRPTRAALLIAAAALTPALLFTAPAFAAAASTTPVTPTSATACPAAPSDPGTPVDEMTEDELRAAIQDILTDANAGRGVLREANEALGGTVDALRAFLETGYALAQAEDDSVAVVRILGAARQNGDKAVLRAATNALDAHTPEALSSFRWTGYRLAQAEDDSVYIVRMLADPNISDAMNDAIQAVLDDGTPEALRHFRTVGQYEIDG